MSSFRKITEENFMTLKINRRNAEAYLEHCQASVELAHQMKNLREKDAYKSCSTRGKLDVGHLL